MTALTASMSGLAVAPLAARNAALRRHIGQRRQTGRSLHLCGPLHSHRRSPAELKLPTRPSLPPRLHAVHDGDNLRGAASQATANSGEAHQNSGHRDVALASAALWFLSESAVYAEEGEPGYSVASYSVSLGLFLLTLPGLWSLIKRAPKAAVKARVYAVDGPSKPDAMPLDDRARQIFAYFKKYNYRVVDTGEVITFEGTYTSNKGQAASLVLYTFVSLLCCGLVLTIVAPWGGNWWYGLSALSPLAGAYYLDRGERVEQVKVKMVTSDDDSEVDITVQGDPEELDRLSKELGLMEKGKVYVKGLLEQ